MIIHSPLADEFLVAIYKSIEYTEDPVNIYEVLEQVSIAPKTLDLLVEYLKDNGFIDVDNCDEVRLLEKGARYAEHIIEKNRIYRGIFG